MNEVLSVYNTFFTDIFRVIHGQAAAVLHGMSQHNGLPVEMYINRGGTYGILGLGNNQGIFQFTEIEDIEKIETVSLFGADVITADAVICEMLVNDIDLEELDQAINEYVQMEYDVERLKINAKKNGVLEKLEEEWEYAMNIYTE
jgi:hypothetical protein